MSESSWNDWSGRILKLLAPILIGWLVGSLMNISGDRVQTQQNTKAIERLENQFNELSKNYATNKRVDDLTDEVRSNYRDLKNTSDQILKILVERR